MSEWEPIGHVPPLPRIDLHPKWRRDPPTYAEQMEEFRLKSERIYQGERIWKLVEQCAQGANRSDGAGI